jgi:signal transduction histidine kinase
MKFGPTLSQRLSLVFALLLLGCSGLSMWVQWRASERHEQEVIQRLSGGLAEQIARSPDLMMPGGFNPAAVHDLFDKLMAVNPSVEVYLLDADGRIAAHAAPDGHLQRDRVDLAPVRQLLAGAPLPILGDDPRGGADRKKVFNAAPVRMSGRDAGYVYVVLQGEAYDALATRVGADDVLRSTLWSMALVAVLGLLAGLLAFHWITRPLRQLTEAVRRFDASQGAPVSDEALARAARGGGEIATLGQAFTQMARRIAQQLRELTAADQQRREMFANLSHDLRTPLTSLHGYLETLLLKADVLDARERRRYLEIALDQSRRVGRLAQELFELARLESGLVKPSKEPLALADVVQDLFQKFELAAEARRQRLVADLAPGLPMVQADAGMIERVLTNLLDNAIRHTPGGGEVRVRLRPVQGAAGGSGVAVEISDSGPGISAELAANLFTRPVFSAAGGRIGGLGLMTVQCMLRLHGSDIRLLRHPGQGATFAFQLA